MLENPKIAIDAATELYGVLGNPIHHSLSPHLHNSLFKHFGMNAAYMAFEVEINSLGLAFEAVRTLNIRGVNLTIPFKEDAINYIDEIPEDLDRCIGALNTVVNKNGILYGYNTDSTGFLIALKEELKFNPAGKNILVLGAGGAARGVAFALSHARAEKIWVYNRTADRAVGLVQHLEDFFPDTELETADSLQGLEHEKIDLVVNATSCGMNEKDVAPIDLKILKGKPSVYDLIYSPKETKLLKAASDMDLPHANGLGMLAAQAALAFELWTGKKDVLAPMKEILKKC